MTTAARSTPSRPLGLSMTSFDPAFRANPHPILQELRESMPVVLDTMLQVLVLTRAADVEAVLRDRELLVDCRKAPERTFMRMFADRRDSRGRPIEPSMLQLDPPEHDHLRGLVNKAFTQRAVDAMRRGVQAIIDGLLDAVADRDEWDLIGDLAAPLPTIVIAEMLGVGREMQKQFKEWSDVVIHSFNPFLNDEERRRLDEASDALKGYFLSEVRARRAGGRDDLLTAMVQAEVNGEKLDDHEIVTMANLLLLAGNLTTTDLIGNGMYAFLTRRDQWDLLKQRPELAQNAVEEMLRFDPPVTQGVRLSSKETEVGGCPVHAGQVISPNLLAANHDPAVNPDPHRFDITREQIRHVSFGGGRHYCLGAPLARLETRLVVETLARRFPNLRLATDRLSWRNVPMFRGLLALPVTHR